ncbi:MAG: SDR family NAD(P)-dependent oxidoreductase, partial [Bacteroidota bacterium]
QVESYGEFMNGPEGLGKSFAETLANNPQQKPELVVEAIQSLLNTPDGERPFRTVVDTLGMGAAVAPFNEAGEGMMKGIYGAFQMDGMLAGNN